jgi:outer membrane receptor protein involved in Fe transport
LKETVRFLFLVILLLPFNQFLFSQNNHFTVSGVIFDSLKAQPIEFASVAIYLLPDTVLVTGAMTNQDGEFLLTKLVPGKYLLKSSFIGYLSRLRPVEIIGSSVKLEGTIYLTESTFSLNEVQVTGIQDEKNITIEKTKINIDQNISAVSGNVTDVLKSQPSINIDLENNVYLRGNKNILILMDGVPTTITTLNSIPASGIESIEIITNPDAKFDAEGTGGIINIITKKHNLPGFSGAATLNYGFTNRFNGGLNLHYSQNIWDVSFNYNGKYEEISTESNLTRHLYSDNISIEQGIKSIQINSTQMASIFLTVKPAKKETLSLSVKFIRPNLTNSQHITGHQVSDSISDVFYDRINEITYSRHNIESTLSFKHSFVKNINELSVDASFSMTKGSRPAEYYLESELMQKSSGGGKPTYTSIQADHFFSVFKTGKIESGLKVFSRWNRFNYEFYDLDTASNQWVINSAFSNDLDHKEFIYSGYVMYSDSLLSRIYFKIGARLEYSTSQLIQHSLNEKTDKEYIFPFPYLLIKQNINKTQSIALSVNRRITRPTYPQLNPYVNVIDQMTYETGNKDLDPEILDKLELNYSLTREKFQFRTNLYGSITRDFITPVTILLPPDTLVLTYVNGDRQNKFGGEFDLNYTFNKYLSINSGIALFHTKSTGQHEEIDLRTNDWAWTGNVKTIIRPMKQTEIQLILNYNSPIALPQFNLDEIYYADIALKRTFLNNKLSVSLTLTDIFNTRNWDIQSDNPVYFLTNTSKIETRILWIGLAYNLNAFKSGKAEKNQQGENDSGIIKLGQ